MEVFHSSPNQLNNTKDEVQGNLSRDTKSNKHPHNKTKVPTQHDSSDLNNVDCVPLNGKFSRFGAVLCIFEDNEAVVRMIIKGRSPTTRHVTRTHRVALNLLLDRVILDSKIQIKYVDTKNQHADMLTTSNFTRDEWNILLYVVNISHSSSLLLRSEIQLDQLHQNDGEKGARTGRRQQDRGKVKADDDELGRLCLDEFFDCEQSDCVERPGDTQSTLFKYGET